MPAVRATSTNVMELEVPGRERAYGPAASASPVDPIFFSQSRLENFKGASYRNIVCPAGEKSEKSDDGFLFLAADQTDGSSALGTTVRIRLTTGPNKVYKIQPTGKRLPSSLFPSVERERKRGGPGLNYACARVGN